MRNHLAITSLVLAMFFAVSCNNSQTASTTADTSSQATVGMASIQDTISQKNVVQIAEASADHSTLVKAIQAADLANVLANPGPFTVFAPTNEAFNALPAGTVDNLLKPESKDKLSDILEYHVAVAVYKESSFTDGQSLAMVNGGRVTFHVKDGKVMINDANIVASVPASNGIVYVIDKVLLPPSK
jgi:uncharacterized surface protein with fasciclin (FAS1) repeats